MKSENNRMKVGSIIELIEDLKMYHVTYKRGHRFTIINEGLRGFDIMDDDGNIIQECRLIHSIFKLAD